MNISIHRIKTFKSCRRQYQLKYIEELEPMTKTEALESGKRYHDYIDKYYKGEEIEEEPTKEYAMFIAFKKYIAPRIDMKTTEQKFTYKLMRGKNLVGIIDGLGDDHLNEHKTTGETNLEEYLFMLGWDEQILAYMLATGLRKIVYDVLRKPNIRQKVNETDEDFFQRMVDWYDEDTDKKILVATIMRTDEEVETFRQDIVAIAKEMTVANRTKLFYRNTCACNLYNRMCEYAPICLHNDPEYEMANFCKRTPVDFSDATKYTNNNEGEKTKWNF